MEQNNHSLNGYTPSSNGTMPATNGHEVTYDPSQITLPWVEKLLASAPTAKKESPEAEPSKKMENQEASPAQKKAARYRETGNSINVRNFYILKQIVFGFGNSYVSPNPLYALPSLDAIYTAANRAVEKVAGSLSLNQQDIDAQTIAYMNLKKDATRSKSVFATCGAPTEAIKRCDSINSLIQGQRIIKLDNTDAKDRVSASHQSHANQIRHVESLIELLLAYPEYVAPADLTDTAWTTKRDAMYNALQAVITTSVDLKMTRLNRNQTIYAPTNGLVDVAYSVKKVVLSIFGARSPQYRMVSGIEFTRIKDYKNL